MLGFRTFATSSVKSVAVLVVGLLVALGPSLAWAEVTQDPPEKVMSMMVEAIKAKSYPDFVIETDDKFKAAVTLQMFDGVSNQVAPRLQAGYKTKFLAKLRQQGASVYVWKLEFTDGKDDMLVKMAIKDKKVAGFLVQ
ncbi:MAG TPA: hypothetical protein VGF45_08570 [Polyangia bacterium]